MREINFDISSLKEHSDKKNDQTSAPQITGYSSDVTEARQDSSDRITDTKFIKRIERNSEALPEEDSTHLGRIIFVLLIVIAFGLGVGSYALFGNPFHSPLAATSTAPVPTTDDIEVPLFDSPRAQVLADLSIAFGKTYLPKGASRSIIFTTKDSEGSIQPATANQFLLAVTEKNPPASLLFSLASPFTYQVYSSSTLEGVMQFTSRSYANTYASTLEWELEMAQSLIPVLHPFYGKKILGEIRGRNFRDAQYGGINFRGLYDLDGNSVLAYALINRKTLIIAGSDDALYETIIEKTRVK